MHISQSSETLPATPYGCGSEHPARNSFLCSWAWTPQTEGVEKGRARKQESQHQLSLSTLPDRLQNPKQALIRQTGRQPLQRKSSHPRANPRASNVPPRSSTYDCSFRCIENLKGNLELRQLSIESNALRHKPARVQAFSLDDPCGCLLSSSLGPQNLNIRRPSDVVVFSESSLFGHSWTWH